MPLCTLECVPLAGSDGIELFYNQFGECYTARENGYLVCAVRFEVKPESSERAFEVHYYPLSEDVDPLDYVTPTLCPSTSGAATSTDLGNGHVKVVYPVPPTRDPEWGWDYAGGAPPKLVIKIRVKRT